MSAARPPPTISACEWLNRYATDAQKWATPFELSRTAVPEVVVKLALECRCSGVCSKCHNNIGRFRKQANSDLASEAKAAGRSAEFFAAQSFESYECRPCSM